MIQGDFLRRPRAAHGWELLAALFAGGLATLVLSRSGAVAGLPLLAFGSAALWGGSYWLFSQQGLFLSALIPQSVLVGTFALLSFLRLRLSEREAAEFSRKLSLTQDVIIQSMAALAETRDNETGGHIQRTRHYVKILAERLRDHPRFHDFLDDQTIELLYKLAPMHDIGKVGVRDHVLLKPERLTVEEYEEMKRHTVYGDDTLELAERHLGDSSFLRIAREFALTHQERWDGRGYPQGLKGEQIPIAGRLMAVADVYDALVSRRIYKEPQTHEQATAVLAQGRGTHFDPDVTDAFLEHQEQFKAIAARFADSAGRGATAMETAATPSGP
jgi:response regulator RpfG family c-di-GMP phosphodiesterase